MALNPSQDLAWFEQRGAGHTAREIYQQPECWRQTLGMLAADEEIRGWLDDRLANGPRIIFTGAGSSAYIGDALASLLAEASSLDATAIATTDIVARPEASLKSNRPTLLVSFARSGNSPESVAAVELADQLLGDSVNHLVITCNRQGELARWCREHPRAYCVTLPSQTHDQGFAMTSSLSSMLTAAMAVLVPSSQPFLEEATRRVEAMLQGDWNALLPGHGQAFERILILGSGVLQGLAREASLKVVELTAGQVVALSETPLGVRHGPKSLVDENTLVWVWRSALPYTRRYDDDLVAEVARDGICGQLECAGDETASGEAMDELVSGLTALVRCQVMALFYSLQRGIGADNPSPSGHVNRVVQGVTLYPYDVQV